MLQIAANTALFSILGTRPILGRVFEMDEETRGSDNVVVLSYGAWQRYFRGDASILGKTLTLDTARYTGVGVMPKEFAYPNAQTDFWKPLALPIDTEIFGLPVTARLKDGVSIAAAQVEANAISRELRGESADAPQPAGLPRIELLSIKEELVAPIRLRPNLVS